MTPTDPTTLSDAENDAAESIALLDTLKGERWVAEGLGAGGGMAVLVASIRPIDRLTAEGLGWLVPHVLPLQAAVDRLAGNASVIRSFTDAWQRASGQVGQVQQELTDSVGAIAAQWQGEAADGYRDFFTANPKPSRKEIFDHLRQLAVKHGYTLPF
jgi:uncharacterized protein YukE